LIAAAKIFILTNTVSRYILMVCLLLVPVSPARSAVVIFDTVASKGEPVRLTVKTKGAFFAQGGRLVDVQIDSKYLGRILSGGDGYGFMKYTPMTSGLKEITARSGPDTDSGLLLVVDRKEKAVAVEVEFCFGKSFFFEKQKTGGNKALGVLADKHRIVYLTRLIGVSLSKKLLAKYRYPRSVIISWQGPETLEELKTKGLNLRAIIASAALISQASEHVARRYTFEETEEGTVVSDWEEILKTFSKEEK
jgi:hypothetical protein